MANKSRRFLSRRTPSRISLLWAVFSIVSTSIAADNPCALLLGGFRGDCVVVAANQKSFRPKSMMALYSGDKIIQKSGVDAIMIKCSPFTSVKKLEATTLQIVHQPPAEKKAVLRELNTFLGFEKDQHERKTAATRSIDGENIATFFPLPGRWATVIPGEPVKFSSEEKGNKAIVFKDSSGVEIFRKSLGEKTSIELTASEIALKPSKTYSWEIEVQGIPRSRETHSLKLLENELIKLVTADFKKLAEEKLGTTERTLRSAAYCQFMSDTYPQDVDLYWKSDQLLKTLEKAELTAEEKTLYQILRERFLQHLQDQTATKDKQHP